MNIGDMIRVTDSPYFAVEDGDIGVLIANREEDPAYPYTVEFPGIPKTWVFSEDEIEAAERG